MGMWASNIESSDQYSMVASFVTHVTQFFLLESVRLFLPCFLSCSLFLHSIRFFVYKLMPFSIVRFFLLLDSCLLDSALSQTNTRRGCNHWIVDFPLCYSINDLIENSVQTLGTKTSQEKSFWLCHLYHHHHHQHIKFSDSMTFDHSDVSFSSISFWTKSEKTSQAMIFSLLFRRRTSFFVFLCD